MRTPQKPRHLQAPAGAAALPSPPGAGRPSPPLAVVTPSDGRHPLWWSSPTLTVITPNSRC